MRRRDVTWLGCSSSSGWVGRPISHATGVLAQSRCSRDIVSISSTSIFSQYLEYSLLISFHEDSYVRRGRSQVALSLFVSAFCI